jgi:FkbM family methyltransferase
MMSSFIEKVKLSIFKVLRTPYKNRLFKDTKTNIELRFLSKLLAQEQLFFIDIGANRGEFIFVASTVLPPTKIWAFEPLPYFAKKTKALFPKITVFDMAVSEEELQTTIYVPVIDGIPDDSLASVDKPEGEFDSYNITCITLDAIIEQEYRGSEKLFLKIDVEGHEFSVLKGAAKTINNLVSVMLIEIEERHHEGETLQEMIESIERLGFTCYYMHYQDSKLIKYADNPMILQTKEEFLVNRYINNFWFFSTRMDGTSFINKLN